MQHVQAQISKHTVFVFSKSYCPYCIKAKQLLKQIGVLFEAEEIDGMANCAEIQAALAQLTGSTTVPQVFVGGKYIGGCSDTEALHKAGKLMQILKDANAQF